MQKNQDKNVLLDIYDFFESKINLIRTEGIKHNNIIWIQELDLVKT